MNTSHKFKALAAFIPILFFVVAIPVTSLLIGNTVTTKSKAEELRVRVSPVPPLASPQNTLLPTPIPSPAQTNPAKGDITGPGNRPDGAIDELDLNALPKFFGKAALLNPSADINGDGVINAVDYAELKKVLSK